MTEGATLAPDKPAVDLRWTFHVPVIYRLRTWMSASRSERCRAQQSPVMTTIKNRQLAGECHSHKVSGVVQGGHRQRGGGLLLGPQGHCPCLLFACGALAPQVLHAILAVV